MPEKCSLRRGNNKKQAPKHANTSAWTHNRKSKLTEKILASPVSGLCQRCVDIVEWRKRYRKYKPLTSPKKCVECQQKTIRDAYHVLCNACAAKKEVCAKCLERKDILPPSVKSPEEILLEELRQKCMISNLSERQRRSYLRKLEKGGSDAVKDIALDNVQSDDDFDFSDSDDEEDNESSNDVENGVDENLGEDFDEDVSEEDDEDTSDQEYENEVVLEK